MSARSDQYVEPYIELKMTKLIHKFDTLTFPHNANQLPVFYPEVTVDSVYTEHFLVRTDKLKFNLNLTIPIF